jgi:hypothetical protein
MKSKRYNEGGDVDPLEEYNKSEGIAVEPGPKAESEPEKPKAAKPRPKPVAKAAAPAPQRIEVVGKRASAAESPMAKDGVPDERARLAARYGTAEQRSKYSKDQTISQQDIDAAKAAGDARRKKIREQDEAFSSARNRSFKRMFGTQAMRDEANMKSGGSAKGYAKGGSVRGGGCEQRGKTKGRFV